MDLFWTDVNNFHGLNITKKCLAAVCWRYSSTQMCYGISQKIFIRYLKKRTLLEVHPGNLPGKERRWNFL